ncbi:hypothetical protein TISLANDTSLP1_13370 [Thermodesulfovibrio yellowstonii]|uniref:Uncharacterized protein n=1 Tax=Thermodesulfovibrio yellowstonii TaxID=28262 RepID=A0A9W6LKI1_9BACT|nr:hypothetical protein TISLANDTSLP1_13370 [Thermodesulfovibrio islandicus]
MSNEMTEILKSHVNEIKKRFHVKEIGIFGSHIKIKAKIEAILIYLLNLRRGRKLLIIIWNLSFILRSYFIVRLTLC